MRGGCTAIGMKKQFPTVIQEDAKELEYMHVSGGKLGMQIRLAPLDLQKVAKAEFADDYFEHEEEYEANIFAGMLLMPESSFRQMYRVFRAQSDNNEMDTLIRLMNYYQVPYMAALVRCYELGLTESGMLTQQLMELDKASIREKIENLWLDSSILDASNKDDYIAVERVVKRMGMEYLQEGYLNERTLRMVLQNMNSLYREIKGEHK